MSDTISKNLRNVRVAHNMYQEELAKLLSVSPKAISAWETGRACPRMGAVSKMCEIFNCTVSELTLEHEDTYFFEKMHKSSSLNTRETAAKKELPEEEDEQRLIKIYRSLSPEKQRELINRAIDLMIQ